ncbi:hypothetical protein CANARDRAFT_27770 [[Candida] arabinofermentans NRRL YB-2248]|uniref:FAD synthase n=1 Tax=[Candida] arabinofermentans NRRL YB-2248 TaxID=983967 RepID=A0A1E4T1Q5_9ASCO|nr:hypothetical protein CANARDRAFT_27770 [[Candida] arabinofermentans NRRL YB-2248]
MTSIIKYNLNLIQINDEMINGFQKYLNQNSKIKAIIVGIRKIDPFGANLNSIQLTDHNWPKFIRINPILNWTYNEIWFFIKFTNIEYCKLYDLGYTSIGGVSNTIRNPLLKLNNGDYLPAYELKDENAERLSRVSDNKINL